MRQHYFRRLKDTGWGVVLLGLCAILLGLVVAVCVREEDDPQNVRTVRSTTTSTSTTTTTVPPTTTTAVAAPARPATTRPKAPPTTRRSQEASKGASVASGRQYERPSGGQKVNSTAYCLRGTMANGKQVHDGAAASSHLPMGSKWKILSGSLAGKVVTIEDRGAPFDIWMSSCSAAINYGRQSISIARV